MGTNKLYNGVVVLAVVAAIGSVADAEPVRDSGTYSDSKLDKVVQPATVTGKVKWWVGEKVATFSKIWSDKVVTKVAGRNPSADGPAASAAAAPTGGNLYAPAGKSVGSAPAPSSTNVALNLPTVDVPKNDKGVQVFDLKTGGAIPVINLDKEGKVLRNDYGLDTRLQKTMDDKVIVAFPSPDVLLDKGMKALLAKLEKVDAPKKTKELASLPKGKLSRESLDKIVFNIVPEKPIQLAKYNDLTVEEQRFLGGLLLYQQGNQCASAVGLFHKLAKAKGYETEADFYLAMCSRKLGLTTDFYERASRVLEKQDVHYSRKLLKEIGTDDVPYEYTGRFGNALMKAAGHPEIMNGLDAASISNVAFILSQFGASTERYKTALEWSRKVSPKHPKHLQSRFVEALALYQNGQKAKGMELQEQLINDLAVDGSKVEFQALVALNAARMYFQEGKFKQAHKAFLRVYKDHPLWLQSLTELGWSQLQSGDLEGAIGNMYSIQSPFFASTYKPESFVIRTIGYLNLCQYGDAYKTLTILEHEYRPVLAKIERYTSANPDYYKTVRGYLTAPKGTKEVDGVPSSVVREMARHRDFTNLQKALNRQIDERVLYAKLDGELEKSLSRAAAFLQSSQRRGADLRARIASIAKNPALEQNRATWTHELDKVAEETNTYGFQVDLFKEAKAALPDYKRSVGSGADTRISKLKSNIQQVLAARVVRLKSDLARIMDNNELLRYEVFAGSGENIRYQVAGGEAAKRIPASVLPKSKALQWEFEGEYWQDEIGHYRSTLKNNCPDAARVNHASIEGDPE